MAKKKGPSKKAQDQMKGQMPRNQKSKGKKHKKVEYRETMKRTKRTRRRK